MNIWAQIDTHHDFGEVGEEKQYWVLRFLFAPLPNFQNSFLIESSVCGTCKIWDMVWPKLRALKSHQFLWASLTMFFSPVEIKWTFKTYKFYSFDLPLLKWISSVLRNLLMSGLLIRFLNKSSKWLQMAHNEHISTLFLLYRVRLPFSLLSLLPIFFSLFLSSTAIGAVPSTNRYQALSALQSIPNFLSCRSRLHSNSLPCFISKCSHTPGGQTDLSKQHFLGFAGKLKRKKMCQVKCCAGSLADSAKLVTSGCPLLFPPLE